VQLVGGLKDLAHLFDVLRIIEVDIGVPEMQFEPSMKLGILGASRQLVKTRMI
jgi:hypothetical protein